MIHLWFSILSSTLIYVSFKIRPRINANLSGAIIVNYLTATLLGLATNTSRINIETVSSASWLPIAIIIGLLFVVMFFLIGTSSHKVGITVTSLATRMSMIIPIAFSLFLFDEVISLPKILKIILTLVAVVLAIYHKPEKNIKPIMAFLPLILFIGSGSVDTLVKTAQHLYIPENEVPIFSSSLFGISFLASLILLFTKKPGEQVFAKNTIPFGILLGAFNFGSLYFLINALNQSGIESSLIFGINNLSIVCISLITGRYLFKEKLTKLNWIGICLSLLCIVLLINF